MTPFRTSQARVVLLGTLRAIAPHMVAGTLRELVSRIWADETLWRELEQRPLTPPASTPEPHP